VEKIAIDVSAPDGHLALEHEIDIAALVALAENDLIATVLFQTQILYNSFDLFFQQIGKQRHLVNECDSPR
jgi:hypothetical protein